MTTIIVQSPEKKTGPVPATGHHAERLGDIEAAAHMLLRFVQAERVGAFDELKDVPR